MSLGDQESGILEKPDKPAPKDVWTPTVDPLDAPDVPTKFSATFKEGRRHVLARSAPESNPYTEEQASMDTLEGFSPEDTCGFIAIQAIHLEKYGAAKIQHEPVVPHQ
ncbi:hypothetical protein GE09DRAFT_1223463 [Coniochaeta sp. 2T2.1]|nr:hypothetical protein GE09DRAFT_1223463 [Coniochaeta sp. 2T2.1]